MTDLLPAVHGGVKSIRLECFDKYTPHVLTYGTIDGTVFRLENADVSDEDAIDTSDTFLIQAYV
ncbi:MAG: hypothetical protein U5K00_01190 [Melioribacteraceae bacterium]|nr:hypothetical protein [Melioribacteraceae bacterium]